MHSLEIVQWDSTRRDHPGYPGRVSGSGPVMTPEGAAWLMDLDGNQFSEPTNVDQLKKFYV